MLKCKLRGNETILQLLGTHSKRLLSDANGSRMYGIKVVRMVTFVMNSNKVISDIARKDCRKSGYSVAKPEFQNQYL